MTTMSINAVRQIQARGAFCRANDGHILRYRWATWHRANCHALRGISTLRAVEVSDD